MAVNDGFCYDAVMEYRTRKIVKPADLNPRNTLFGGRLMEWVDEECAIYAACQLETANLVTKFVGEFDFKSPARQGDIVEIGVETTHIGQTSIILRCEVRNKTTKQTILAINKVVFVCVDLLGKPTLHGKGESGHQVVS
jgi:acyl-CoA hydrolase